MTFQQIIASSLEGVTPQPSIKPTPKQLKLACVVEAVSPVSLAAHAGIKAGDVLISINDKDAVAFSDMTFATLSHNQYQYRFFRPNEQGCVDVTTNGTPLGVRFRPTKQAMIELAQNYYFSQFHALSLWRTQDWALMHVIADTLMHITYGRTCDKALSHAFGYRPKYLGHLLKAIALFETGKPAEAKPYFDNFITLHPGPHLTAIHALFDYYVMRYHKDYSPTQHDEALWQDLSFALEGIEPNELDHWVGQKLELDYTLPIMKGTHPTDQQLSLGQTIAGMKPEQLFFLTLIPERRTALIWEIFLREYLSYYRQMPEMIAGMHMVTNSQNYDPVDMSSMEEEEKFHATFGGFEVLFDADSQLMDYISPNSFPYALVLDHTGTIIHAGGVKDDVTWSNLLATHQAYHRLEAYIPDEMSTESWKQPNKNNFMISTAVTVLAVCSLLLKFVILPHLNQPITSEILNERYAQHLIADKADIFSQAQEEWIGQYHAHILAAYDIDFRVTSVNTADNINIEAAKLFEAMKVGSLSKNKRGLLLMVDPTKNMVRLEVGRSLEGVYTDAFVKYIQERQMVPFFKASRVSDGILATTEMIATRAKEAIADKAFDPTNIASFEASTGAGAKSNAQIGAGYQRQDTNQANVNGVGDPLTIVTTYLSAMESGNSRYDLAIYSQPTQRMMKDWVMTAAQMKNMVKAYRSCPQAEVKIEETYAVIRYDVNKRECSPFFLVQENGQWKLDLTKMTTTIRFNHRNYWRFLNGIPENYQFGFADWQLDQHGFPFLKK